MAKRMLIDATHPEETRVVVVNGTRVEEFDYESSNKAQVKGNIYLAKITRVEPSLQAAFVEYGGNRHGFLPFSEIHPDYYRIPIADREALLAEEDEIRRAEEAARSQRDDDNDLEEADDNGRLTDVESDQEVSEVHEPGDAEDDSVKSDNAEGDGAEDAGAQDNAADNAPDEADETGGAEAAAANEASSDVDDADLPVTALTNSADDDDQGNGDQVDKNDQVNAAEGAEAPSDDTAAQDEGAAPEGHDVVGDTVEPAQADKVEDEGEAIAQSSDDTQSDDNRDEGREEGRSRGRRRRRRSGPSRAARSAVAEIQEEVDTNSDSPEDLDDVARRRARLMRRYKIQEVIKRRQVLLIQVTKEERGNKGAALTTYLSLAGRYCVLMPNTAKGGGISRKISNVNDRRRLKTVLNDLDIVDGMAVIVRTAGSQRTKTEIRRDYEYLLRLWNDIRNRTMESVAPSLIHEEADLIKRCVRDLYSREMDEVLVEGEAGHKAAKSYMRMLTPSHAKHVKLYSNPSMPLFHKFRVEEQLNAMHATTVTLRSGGSIVLNQTEALVAIDVNSGKATRERHIETTALKTNLEAAEEVARQLRLRDLAGLIVIDFIDMEDPKHNREVERRLKDSMKQDRARIQLGRISPFGLLELSRQRLRPSLFEWATESCSACNGTGWVRATDSAALQVLRALIDEAVRRGAGEIQVKTPTRVALYLLNENRSQVVTTEQRYGVQIMIRADDDLDGQEYEIERLSTGPITIEGEAQEVIEPVEDEVTDDVTEDRDNEEEEGRGRRRERRGSRRRRGERSERGDRSDRGERGERPARGDDAADAQDTESSDAQDGDDNRNDQPERDGDDSGNKRRRRGKRGGRRRGRRRDEETGQDQDESTTDATGDSVDQPDGPTEQAAAAESSDSTETVSESIAAPAEPGATADGNESNDEVKPKPRRRRTRRKVEDTPAEATANETPADDSDEEEKPKPRRRTRKKAEPAAAASDEGAVASGEEEAPSPLTRKRRTRKPKAVDVPIETGPAEGANANDTAGEMANDKGTDTGADEEKPKPRRRRTAKKKDAVAEQAPVQSEAVSAHPVAAAAEPVAAAPSVPASTAPAAPEPVAAQPVAPVADDKPAKPRRKGWWNRLLE